jgi:hypothetical protein
MAITKAREDLPVNGVSSVAPGGDNVTQAFLGASGGSSPEGYGLLKTIGSNRALGGVENAKVDDEGVSTRSKEETEELEKASEEFMKSKETFDKSLEESKKQLAKGKPNTKVQKELLKAEEKTQKEAEKKATVPGGDPTGLSSPIATKTAEQTKKIEAADVAKSEVTKLQAQGNTEGAEKKKEEVKKLDEQVKQEVKK